VMSSTRWVCLCLSWSIIARLWSLGSTNGESYGAEGTDQMAGALRGGSVMCQHIAGLRNEGRRRAVWLARGGFHLLEPVSEDLHKARLTGGAGLLRVTAPNAAVTSATS
jgi:hypothetical protein